MKTLNFNPQTIVLSMGLAGLMLTVSSLNAQDDGNRGLFSKGYVADEEEAYSPKGLMNIEEFGIGYNLYNQQFGGNWDVDGYGFFNLYNQYFGQETPLGNGILFLTAAGAAYALRKRKRNDNKQKS